MMSSSDSYLMRLETENLDYDELINKRNSLIDAIRQFEDKERDGDRSGHEWDVNPDPEVRYQCNLSYLSKLCSYMSGRYNAEYVRGEKRLSDTE